MMVLLALHVGNAAAQTGDSGTVVRGMFGPRVMGEPLRPKPSQSGGGIIRGPSGEFYGIGRSGGALFQGNRRPNVDRLNQTVPVPPAWRREEAVPAGVADAYRSPPEPISFWDTPLRQPSEPLESPLGESADDVTLPLEESAVQEPTAPTPPPPQLPSPQKPEPLKPVSPPGTVPAAQPVSPPAAQPAAQPRPLPGDQWLRTPKPSGAVRPAPAMEVPGVGLQSSGLPVRRRAMPGVMVVSPSETRLGVPAGSPSVAVESLLRENPRAAKSGRVRVSIEGDVLVLRGRVATMHDRAVAEAAARMEPGIEKVRNELLVEPSAAVAR